MADPQSMAALAALIKGLKGDDPKELSKALALEGACPRCQNRFQWSKGIDILARTVSCPKCRREILSF
jgi:hypothetical protein